MKLDIKLVKPKIKGESDKYSWNLWRWLNKYKWHRNVYFRITEDSPEFNINNIKASDLYIGTMDSTGLSGNRLGTILGKGIGKDDCFAFHPIAGWRNDEFIDITDIFWKEYINIGRCLFTEHSGVWIRGDEDRFSYTNNTRKCNWCGKWQHKEIIKEVKIKRHEVWV